MSDVAFLVLTIAVFAVLALTVRGVERLVGQSPGNEPAAPIGGEGGTERAGGYSSVAPSSVSAHTVGVGNSGAHADGQVAR